MGSAARGDRVWTSGLGPSVMRSSRRPDVAYHRQVIEYRPSVSQLCHAFGEPEGNRGHERTRKRIRLSTGGHEGKRRATRGHDIRPVRDREARVQIPGPRPNVAYLNSALARGGRDTHQCGKHSTAIGDRLDGQACLHALLAGSNSQVSLSALSRLTPPLNMTILPLVDS